jgi:Ti-type conjugative transfer relaxase TraA
MFTPKKLGASSGSAANYYAEEFHREDYYAKGKEPPGVWVGGQSLELHGTLVNTTDLKNLFEGNDLQGKALVQGAGERHAPGWDMPFSAPKSVSVLWGTADANTRQKIAEIHEKAVDTALAFLSEHSLSDSCRRGKAGVHREAPNELIYAKFQHGTSREHDPQLHTHVILLNVAKRHDGTWGALQPDGIYRDAKLVSALYRAELAAGLREELGIGMERDGVALRVAGFDKNVEKMFSKRRMAIEKLLNERGQDGLRASAGAALVTRTRKKEIDRDVLMDSWKEQATGMSFDPVKAMDVSRNSNIKQEKSKENRMAFEKENLEKSALESVSKALSELSEKQSTFTKHKLFESIALQLQGEKSVKEIREVFEKALRHPEILALEGFDKNGAELFTTKSLRTIEERLLEYSDEFSQNIRQPSVLARDLKEKDQERFRSLSPEQLFVVEHVTDGKQLSLVQGWAGAGKSFTMAAAREVFEEQGLQVVGVAPTGKAADNLSLGSGIPSQTIDSFLYSKGQNLLSKVKGVILVDEAGMVGSRKMEALFALAKEREAKIVLVGDSRQLSPIDAGAAFRVLEARIGSRSLTEIRRQSILWQREAVKSFAEGRPLEGISAYREAGYVTLSQNGNQRDDALIASWKKENALKKSSTLILATTNEHVQRLNSYARIALKEEGILNNKDKEFFVTTRDGSKEERLFQKGERIVFTKNSREIGVRNGQFGTIEFISERRQKSGTQIKVKLDSDKMVSFNANEYTHLEYGYASTVYKAQGSTIEKVYLAHSAGMGLEAAYVAISRHKTSLEIFLAKDSFGENDWNKILEKPLSVSEKNQKLSLQLAEMTQDYERKLGIDLSKAQEKKMSTDFEISANPLEKTHDELLNLERKDAERVKTPARNTSIQMGM